MVRVRIRFSVWLVSCYAHVFVLLSIVIVTDRFGGYVAELCTQQYKRRQVSTCSQTGHGSREEHPTLNVEQRNVQRSTANVDHKHVTSRRLLVETVRQCCRRGLANYPQNVKTCINSPELHAAAIDFMAPNNKILTSNTTTSPMYRVTPPLAAHSSKGCLQTAYDHLHVPSWCGPIIPCGDVITSF